jgi:hypothetical protein
MIEHLAPVYTRQCSLLAQALIQRSAWKGYSANFVSTAFSEKFAVPSARQASEGAIDPEGDYVAIVPVREILSALGASYFFPREPPGLPPVPST